MSTIRGLGRSWSPLNRDDRDALSRDKVVALDTEGRREHWYPLFAWIYTCCWVCCLIYVWVNYGRMLPWLRIATAILLILTTPAGADLLLIRRYWRGRGSRYSGTSIQ